MLQNGKVLRSQRRIRRFVTVTFLAAVAGELAGRLYSAPKTASKKNQAFSKMKCIGTSGCSIILTLKKNVDLEP